MVHPQLSILAWFKANRVTTLFLESNSSKCESTFSSRLKECGLLDHPTRLFDRLEQNWSPRSFTLRSGGLAVPLPMNHLPFVHKGARCIAKMPRDHGRKKGESASIFWLVQLKGEPFPSKKENKASLGKMYRKGTVPTTGMPLPYIAQKGIACAAWPGA